MRRDKEKEVKHKENRRTRQRGSAMLETALVFTLLLTMILFIVDMGRVLLTQQFISERARVGARNAALNNWTATDVANFVVYNSTTAPPGGGPGYLGLLPSQVSLTQFADSGNNDARYKVTVQGVPLFTWVPYLAGRYTAPTITATMPVQSQGATN